MRIVFLLTLLIVSSAQAGAGGARFFVDGHPVTAKHYSVFVFSGQTVELRIEDDSRIAESMPALEISFDNGLWNPVSPNSGTWTAPNAPGSHTRIQVSLPDRRVEVLAFVMVPFDAKSQVALGEFEFGQYPDPSAINSNLDYNSPRGMVRVTAENQSLRLSPHFQLAQFLCKQEGDWPKYIAPDTELYQNLEVIYDYVREQGIDIDTLTVMSGYRTPAYNQGIGNVAFSRHVYGDATDLFIDADADGFMDDLNNDGKFDLGDAELFATWINDALAPDTGSFVGGLGTYAEKDWRGPFVHFDMRGGEARWTIR